MAESLKVVGSIAGIAGISILIVLYIIKEVITKVDGVNPEQSFHLLNRIIGVATLIVVMGILAWVASLIIDKGYWFSVKIDSPVSASESQSSSSDPVSHCDATCGQHATVVLFLGLFNNGFKSETAAINDTLAAVDWHGMYGATEDDVREVLTMYVRRVKRTGSMQIQHFNLAYYYPAGDAFNDIVGHKWALVVNENDEVGLKKLEPIERVEGGGEKILWHRP
ncbi:hypothetical protein [Rheinheimera fenheensis]|uniref:hypothetical protein n=1 Tax=Rheinheimera fenheensis TaxID=3152295 RepID=UPI00325C469E